MIKEARTENTIECKSGTEAHELLKSNLGLEENVIKNFMKSYKKKMSTVSFSSVKFEKKFSVWLDGVIEGEGIPVLFI